MFSWQTCWFLPFPSSVLLPLFLFVFIFSYFFSSSPPLIFFLCSPPPSFSNVHLKFSNVITTSWSEGEPRSYWPREFIRHTVRRHLFDRVRVSSRVRFHLCQCLFFICFGLFCFFVTCWQVTFVSGDYDLFLKDQNIGQKKSLDVTKRWVSLIRQDIWILKTLHLNLSVYFNFLADVPAEITFGCLNNI